MLTVTIEPPRQPEIEELLRLSDEFALSLYPPESCYMLDVAELEVPEVTVFVARVDGEVLGMAALVDRSAGTSELKRMFVHDRARGKGVASAIMAAIERHALEVDASIIQLETGPKQPEAIALYEKHGFRIIPNFGQYIGDESSVCMQKDLVHA